jgi:hypothetical protein
MSTEDLGDAAPCSLAAVWPFRASAPVRDSRAYSVVGAPPPIISVGIHLYPESRTIKLRLRYASTHREGKLGGPWKSLEK